jgi:flavin reductase (DIM6/NTAB) family NADH-FMN oxidoreductase RutF
VTEVAPLLDRLDTTACVVTTAHEGRPAGCIVTYLTAASITAARPRLLVLTSHENLTHELVALSNVLAIHPWRSGKRLGSATSASSRGATRTSSTASHGSRE